MATIFEDSSAGLRGDVGGIQDPLAGVLIQLWAGEHAESAVVKAEPYGRPSAGPDDGFLSRGPRVHHQ